MLLRRILLSLAAIYFSSLLLYCVWYGNLVLLEYTPTCSLEGTRKFVSELCQNYSKGHITGSFCDSLCGVDVELIECLSHKPTNVVILAGWKQNGHKLMLKADRLSNLNMNQAQPSTYASFVKLISSFSKLDLPYSTINHILSECDINSDGLFTLTETRYCWNLVSTREILSMFELSSNSAIPSLYGTCGNMMAVEYASTDPLVQLPITKEYRSWKLRAKIAIALIEMVENVEDTKYGTLYLCDFQRSNFGFIEDINGHYIAKSIDNDLSLFESELTSLIGPNKSCSTHSDCIYHRCESQCNYDTGKCSGISPSINLQLLCHLFLKSQLEFFYIGLLWKPPIIVRKELESILDQCAYSLNIKFPWHLTTKLKNLLHESLH